MNITILTNLSEKKLSEIGMEYKKRLGGYCTCNITKAAKTKKAYFINAMAKDTYISSEEFAGKISDIALSGYSRIVFDAGSNSADVKKFDYEFTLTSLDVSEDMFIAMLLEQIYRAFKINSSETYHK